jgi:hypothetical protein
MREQLPQILVHCLCGLAFGARKAQALQLLRSQAVHIGKHPIDRRGRQNVACGAITVAQIL